MSSIHDLKVQANLMSRLSNSSAIASLIVLISLCAWASSAFAQDHSVGVSLGLYSDDGELDGTERIAVKAPESQDRTFGADNISSISLWYLRPLSESLRWGGGLRYYGTYSILDEVPEDTEEEDLPTAQEFGTLSDLYIQMEWHTPLVEGIPLELVVGTQLGMNMLFPGGALQAEIDRLKEQNVGVFDGPRLGFLFGPQVGVRYQVLKLVGLRADFGARYNRLFLFSTSEEVDGVAFAKEWNLNVLRYDFSFGVEVTF